MSDSLGDRQKEYEAASKTRLTRRVPVICRLDGKAFSSFTSNLLKPYDERFHRCMWDAAKYLCQNIMGAKLAYVQSDEISILIIDDDTHETQAWFDNQVQKMVSVAASMCAVQFYSSYLSEFPESERKRTLPAFDARVFSVPREDVANTLLWRQQDASRNSLSMLCQSLFSHKQLHGKDREAQHELLYTKGVNWNDCPVPQKRGVCLLKETYTVPATSGGHKVLDPTTREFVSVPDVPAITTRSRWAVDRNIPIFSTPEGRQYITKLVFPWLIIMVPSTQSRYWVLCVQETGSTMWHLDFEYRWRKISDELPGKIPRQPECQILLCNQEGIMGVFSGAKVDKDGNIDWWIDDDYYDGDTPPTHWMFVQLPETPK